MQIDLFSTNKEPNPKRTYDSIFANAYHHLNNEQKAAVDAIEGPVMVIAGPGTGKTQILAVRIGKILKETDTSPHNILCLTFTDAATLAMRKRLVEIIGPVAHQVHIFTFHGFCNHVIQENLGIFGNYRKLELLTEIEEIDVYKEIIEGLPSDHILKDLKGNDQYEMKRLKNLFTFMKKENVSSIELKEKVSDFLKRKIENKADKELYYQRKYKEYQQGDLKPHAWEELHFKMKQLTEASELYATYQKIMHRLGRYDYQDMILWVLEAFEKDSHLLAKYQERYQYVLVDEYQDTNGAQNDLLEILLSYWQENPNIFVVGDDDQAIYKFQGANIENIKEFKTKYRPETIVLKRNYRSSQVILDSSRHLIEKNTERIVNDPDFELDKDLIAEGRNGSLKVQPKVLHFTNETQERAYIIDRLLEEYEKSDDLGDIAVIYRQHSQVSEMVEVLEKKGVPLNVKKRVDILCDPLIANILNIMQYIMSEWASPYSAEHRLAEMMHYGYFDISSNDIAKISMHRRSGINDTKPTFWRDIIAEEELLSSIGVKGVENVLNFSQRLEKWISDISNTTLQILFEYILNEGHILRYVLTRANKSWLLQVLNTFFDLIKSETTKNPDLGLADFLLLIDRMKENNITLSVNKVIHSDKGINFTTAHGSKGLEFGKVIIMGATKDKWDKSPSTRYQYSYPDNLNEDIETNEEDERRLFFVAMTRAEQELLISYAETKDNGRALGASQFVDEIADSLLVEKEEVAVDDSTIEEFMTMLLVRKEAKAKLIETSLIDRVLQSYKLSVTGLNKYLRCPLSFYFEDIIRIPTARNKYMGFGRAIHHALQYHYQSINDQKEVTKSLLIKYFDDGMKDHRSHFTPSEFDNFTAYGKDILSKYFEEYLEENKIVDRYELEWKIDHAEYEGIPIKGVLDRVDVMKNSANVTDYKTGNYQRAETRKKLLPASEKNELGGDYWRQIVFYHLLIKGDSRISWNMTKGTIDFVEPDKKTDKFYQKSFSITPEDELVVGDQIKESWERIQKHDFQNGCAEENCYWCQFVQNDYVVTGNLDIDVEDNVQDI